MRFPTRTTSLAPLILFGTIGCRAVQQVRPAEYIPRHSPNLVWVTTKDAVIPVIRPQIDGDTLRGSDLEGSVAIPMKSIQSVRARAAAPDRTTLIVAALVAAGLYVVNIGGLSTGGSYIYVPDGDCHCVGDVVEAPRR
jgi:hypothetical protein